MKPRILLLDEPLSALDGVIKESIKERIKTIAREYHLTSIIVTHDPEEALTLSDRVLIIDGGRIAQYGQPPEIIHRPNNDFVHKFILNQLEIKRNNIYALFGRHGGRLRLLCTGGRVRAGVPVDRKNTVQSRTKRQSKASTARLRTRSCAVRSSMRRLSRVSWRQSRSCVKWV